MTIRKSIRVGRAPAIAFRVFTEEMRAWWPLREGFTFQRGHGAQDIFIEGRIGGRFYERFADGTEFEIGRVTGFYPPRSVAFTWKDPDWEGPTEIEVRFSPDGGGTRVDVEHRGWTAAGARAEKEGKSYGDGWDVVLSHYAASAAA